MRHKVPTFLSDSEVKDILRQPNRLTLLGKRDFAILLLMLQTGLRKAEVCSLQRGNLKVEGKKVWLYVRGKGDRERRIPVKSLELIEALQIYWRKAKISNRDDEPFFKRIGKGWSAIPGPIGIGVVRGIVEKYSRLAKIPKNIHPHSLRHTFITEVMNRSGDIVAAQALAGHSKITTTQRYLHTTDDRMERALEKLVTDE